MNAAVIGKIILYAVGLVNAFSGAALVVAPLWFYENIGKFPPFNRHFLGDTGSFLFPIGVGVLFAARAPAHHRNLIGIAALANAIHALNHVYDSIVEPSPDQLFSNTIPVLVIAVALSWVWWDLSRNRI